jgi:hypothetical protein
MRRPKIGLGDLAMNNEVAYYFFMGLFLLFIYSMFSLMMSVNILLKLAPRNHWYNASFFGTIYWLLTKEAREVVNSYYQFNLNKGVAK